MKNIQLLRAGIIISFLLSTSVQAKLASNIDVLNKIKQAIWVGVGWVNENGKILVDPVKNLHRIEPERKEEDQLLFFDDRIYNYTTIIAIHPYPDLAAPRQGAPVFLYKIQKRNKGSIISVRFKEAKKGEFVLEPQTKLLREIANNVKKQDIENAGSINFSAQGMRELVPLLNPKFPAQDPMPATQEKGIPAPIRESQMKGLPKIKESELPPPPEEQLPAAPGEQKPMQYDQSELPPPPGMQNKPPAPPVAPLPPMVKRPAPAIVIPQNPQSGLRKVEQAEIEENPYMWFEGVKSAIKKGMLKENDLPADPNAPLSKELAYAILNVEAGATYSQITKAATSLLYAIDKMKKGISGKAKEERNKIIKNARDLLEVDASKAAMPQGKAIEYPYMWFDGVKNFFESYKKGLASIMSDEKALKKEQSQTDSTKNKLKELENRENSLQNALREYTRLIEQTKPEEITAELAMLVLDVSPEASYNQITKNAFALSQKIDKEANAASAKIGKKEIEKYAMLREIVKYARDKLTEKK